LVVKCFGKKLGFWNKKLVLLFDSKRTV